MHFSLGEKIQGKIAPSPLALAGLMARIPGSHPGYPGYIPGQGIKILLHVTTPCCLAKVRARLYTNLQQGAGNLNIKRLVLNKENQISQIKEFSALLCMGRCKCLGALK